MSGSFLTAFLPELVLLLGALALFVVTLGEGRQRLAFRLCVLVAVLAVVASVAALGRHAVLFDGAYRVDGFSQLLKLVFAVGFAAALLVGRDLVDVRSDVRAEYYFFLALSVAGLTMLVSCIDLITLVVALELSSFPLYLMVPMRREREGQRVQMESAIKYLMFGVAANGVMLFGLSYLFGLTGTTSLPEMAVGLQLAAGSPLVVIGLAMAFCGLFYKLAVFPFHFWTPDVYQGASHETAGIVASLPKVGATAVLVRFAAMAAPAADTVTQLLVVLAIASMLYGNLIALVQKDLKRLLGFSGIAHAGYALIGFTALDRDGYAASIYYIVGYMVMILACFAVIVRVSRDGVNVSLGDLAGLHRREPVLAFTLLVAVFALAGIPPFTGFMGKLAVLSAALAKGQLLLVIVAVMNAAIAIYYYLGMVREAYLRDPGEQPAIAVNWASRGVCLALAAGIVLLGVAPGAILDFLAASL